MTNIAQEPKFVDNGSDNKVPVRKQYKVAAGDGKKPCITKEDPVFNAVYRHTISELKCQICFINTLPTPAESNNIPPAAYSHGACFVSKSGLYHHEDLHKLRNGFNKQWFRCVHPCTCILNALLLAFSKA